MAYATHGAPLPYALTARAALAGLKVYVRAVDTAALPAMPGSGGTSDKALLSFVNFENALATLAVRGRLPRVGKWVGERFGALALGEAVQFILAPPAPRAPYPPRHRRAEPTDGGAALTWSSCAGATTYRVAAEDKVVADGLTQPRYTVTGLMNGVRRQFVVTASNAADTTPQAPPPAPTSLTAIAGDHRVALRWSATPGATCYNVTRTAGPGPATRSEASCPTTGSPGARAARSPRSYLARC